MFSQVLSKHGKTIIIHISANCRPFSTSNQRICGAIAVDCQSVTHSITTTGITSPRKRFRPSIEQQAIVELCRTQNVVVSARPGAGKTATAEAIIAANPTQPIAVLTYSKRLQIDTAQRLKTYLWSDVLTFHRLAGLLFSTTVPTDTILRSLRRKRTVPAWNGKPYEIIILDELQDCTDDLFWLICAFISAVTHARGGKAPRIVVLGDERQAIYQFKGADSRYLSLSSSTLNTVSPYPWTHLTLSKSFRLSHETSAFVNNAFLRGESCIVGSHSGPKPLYLHGTTDEIESLAQHLIPLIRQYGPENTAILAPFVRNHKTLPPLTNYLSEAHSMPIAVPNSDDVPLNDKVLRGKICLSTYHQFKGSERDLVIVYGVDANYFNYFGRDFPDDRCPNAIFVALTRARKHLVMIHDNRSGPMPFVNITELYKTCNFVKFKKKKKLEKSKLPRRPLKLGLLLPKTTYPSDLSRHIPGEIIGDICAKHLKISKTQPPLPDALHINPPSIVLTSSSKRHYEDVSDINSLAVVAAYENSLLGTLRTLGETEASSVEIPSNLKEQAIWLCRRACEHGARISGYRSRSIQMKGHRFDWLVPYLDTARVRLKAQFSQEDVLYFEFKLEEEEFIVGNHEDQSTEIKGRADIIQYKADLSISSEQENEKQHLEKIDSTDVSIWEIKFVAELSLQHVIQACIYAYLWSNQNMRETPPRIFLFNVRNGEKWEISPRDGVASLRAVLEDTLIAKYSSQGTITTEAFLTKCANTKAEVERCVN